MKVCVVEDCEKEQFIHGYCGLHFRRLLRIGKVILKKQVHNKERACWRNMLQRCNNPNRIAYKNYGGRGIKVCKEWYKYENFYRDMGKSPEGSQIDRIDNNGNYEPSNCRWIAQKENIRNRGTTVMNKGLADEIRIMYKNGIKPKDIIDITKVSRSLVGNILYTNGWD